MSDFSLKEEQPKTKAKEPKAKQPKAEGLSKTPPKSGGNVRFRNQQTVEHHLFKAEVAVAKRNRSYQKGVVKLVDIDHAHFFHTVDSRGRQQTRTTSTNGHYHYIEWGYDDNGDLVAKCGPAMREYTELKRGRTRRKEKPVSWIDDRDDGEVTVVDKHVHDMTYMGSDEIQIGQVKAAPDAMAAQKEAIRKAGYEFQG